MSQSLAVVGGAGPTLGAALCDVLTAQRYTPLALSRSRPSDISAEWLPCDLTQADEVAAVMNRIEREHGAVHSYIHNLGEFSHQPFLQTDADAFERLWHVNCESAFNAARALLPAMLERGEGNIVLVGATASTRGSAEFSAFAASKFALRGLAQSLAREFGPRGIHVAHVIIDGVMWSERAQNWGMQPSQCLQPAAVAETIVHVIGQPRDAWTHELDIRPHQESF